MSRTACCFLALGIGVTLAAACGDDDVDFNGVGGSAGSAARGGAAGAAGSGGTNGGAAGNAGSPGNGGTAGNAGSPGQGGSGAGQGGSGAGTGGSAGTGGTGGSESVPDAGPDATTPPDGGGGTGGGGDCPNFETAAEGILEQNGQNVALSRVVFENGGATVTFRGVGNGLFNFADPMQLCSGPEEADCISVSDLDDDVGDDALALDEEVSIFIDDVSSEAGELGLITNVPTVSDAFLFAYVAWGDGFVSVAPSEGGDAGNLPTSLESRAVAGDFWTNGDRIDVGTAPIAINTIYADGDTAFEDGFSTCTGD